MDIEQFRIIEAKAKSEGKMLGTITTTGNNNIYMYIEENGKKVINYEWDPSDENILYIRTEGLKNPASRTVAVTIDIIDVVHF